MRVAPVSADLLIKLALGVVVIGAAVYGARRLMASINGIGSDAWASASGTVADVADWAGVALNPASDGNLVYSGISNAGEAITGVPGWNLGGWLHDAINGDAWADEMARDDERARAEADAETARLLARYPSYTVGPGGAAFGIYPRP